jgi:AraC family transcriptional regulator
MSYPIKIMVKQTKPMTVAFLSVKGHFNQIPAAFGRLYSWIGEKGYKPRGPAIVVYYDIPGQVPDDQLRWELRSQISEDVVAIGPDEQGLGVKRAGVVQVAATTHKGPYEKIEETYRALTAWVAESGYEINGPFEELYFSDAATLPEDLLTEIRFPISRKQNIT